ncbi:MAG: hypothetical protein Q4A05_09610, partial [Ruminococcus sp.]|nr:hypothetical protein [Ruminococcus sp.]
MRQLTEEQLVRSIAEQTERSAAVIGQTDLTRKDFDPTAVIVSSLSNIFDSALVVLALEDESNDRDECYRSAGKLVISSPAVSSEQKDFIRRINAFRGDMSLDSESGGSFDSARCLDFLNSYDCFMYQFYQKSGTVKRMKSEGALDSGFVSFHNILEKLIKKDMLASKSSAGGSDIAAKLDTVIGLLSRIADE